VRLLFRFSVSVVSVVLALVGFVVLVGIVVAVVGIVAGTVVAMAAEMVAVVEMAAVLALVLAMALALALEMSAASTKHTAAVLVGISGRQHIAPAVSLPLLMVVVVVDRAECMNLGDRTVLLLAAAVPSDFAA
jgi:hypothetical protein